MSKEYVLEIILSKVRKFMGSNEIEGSVDPCRLVFVRDEHVDYDHLRVDNSKTITFSEFNEMCMAALVRGPSWIHCNLFRQHGNILLISFVFGDFVGNPDPAVNLSFESKVIQMEDR